MSSLREAARAAGLGRVAYRWLHRPRASLDLARTYGWGLVWRAWQGERAMRRAAGRLAPLPVSTATFAPVVCFLTGERFLHQTLFCAHSFATHAAVQPEFEFLSDGSLTTAHAHELQRLFPRARVRQKDELDAHVAAALPPAAFPVLHAVRKNFVLLRKLTDAMAGARGYRLFLDSDMLFWRKPTELLDRAAAGDPLYLADTVDDGYTANRAELQRALGTSAAAAVNSGLVGLDAGRIDWPLMERACAFLRSASGDRRLLEQTLWAIALGAVSARPLDAAAYRVVVDPPQFDAARKTVPEPILLHYAWRARLPYAGGEWQRYLADLSSAN
jgi:hypothetical protein